MNSKLRTSWSQEVAQHAASGQSEAEWCQVHEIKLSTFIYWRRRLSWSSTPSPAIGFAEIQVKPGPPGSLSVRANLLHSAIN